MPEALGALGGLLLLAMAAGGLLRPRLGARFLPLHRAGAAALLAVLGVHAVMLYAGYPPRAGWHVLGGAGLAGALLTAGVGRLRLRLGPRWLKLHKLMAFAVLAGAAGHVLSQP